MLRSLIMAAVCGFLVFDVAVAADDPTERNLATANAEYEKTTEKARDLLLAALKKKTAAVQKSGDLKALEKIEAETKAFEDTGELPKSVPTKSYEGELRKAKSKLEGAYATAVKGFTQGGKRAEAQAAQQRLEELKLRAVVNAAAPIEGRPGRGVLGNELLTNPGGEEPLVDDRIPGWEPVQGEWRTRTSNPPPAEGGFYFSCIGQVPLAELDQDVSLAPLAKLASTGKLKMSFRGSVRSYNQPDPDSAQIILEFRDAAKHEVLDRWDSGKIKSTDGWQELSDTRAVHKDAAWVRVRLISTRSAGDNNDGYFDSLSLTAAARH